MLHHSLILKEHQDREIFFFHCLCNSCGSRSSRAFASHTCLGLVSTPHPCLCLLCRSGDGSLPGAVEAAVLCQPRVRRPQRPPVEASARRLLSSSEREFSKSDSSVDPERIQFGIRVARTTACFPLFIPSFIPPQACLHLRLVWGRLLLFLY